MQQSDETYEVMDEINGVFVYHRESFKKMPEKPEFLLDIYTKFFEKVVP